MIKAPGRTLIVSDLHLGNDGTYDIFAGAKALPALFERFAAAGNTVILNGDSVDFLMNEDALHLDEARAVKQVDAILSAPQNGPVLKALGHVLAAGGDVIIKLGNHDIELALAGVQERVRAALGQPSEVAARLRFTRGDQPEVLTVGGARIVVSHGEQSDNWNRVDYARLPGPNASSEIPRQEGEFSYAPGSRLVKTLMNPLKREFGLNIIDLIKPDFQGGVLTALAVNPMAVRTVFKGSTLQLMWQLFRQGKAASTFEDDENERNLGLASAIDAADLSPEEREVLAEVLNPDDTNPKPFDNDPLLDSARIKLGRAGLRLYASAQKKMAGEASSQFYALAPASDEWGEAQRLAQKYHAQAVIFGHTHAARFLQKDDLTYLNTGTWIRLVRLPAPEASDEEWTQFLILCRKNPRLDPKKDEMVPLFTRFTGAVIEPHAQGGAQLSLIEWTEKGELTTLEQAHVQAAKESQA